jgi:HD-GYP domain-containing protein (c-di-GMP phosphodiesterase class II)
MPNEEFSAQKRIPVSLIKPGMYVTSLDRSWLETPFFFHRKLIKSAEDIELLKKNGIREVVIDITRGLDVESGAPITETATAALMAGEQIAASQKETSAPAPSAAEMAFRPLAMELEMAQRIHQDALTAAQSIFDGVRGGAPLKREVAQKVVVDLMSSIARSPEANLLMMQMRRFQTDLFTHAVNACVLSLVVRALEGFDVDAAAFGMGALLHDIGETRIPRNLIRKKEEFTESERRLMEQHPLLGAMLLQQNDEMPPLARQIVLGHHERIDGSGYPNRLRDADISFASQVVAITDAYDDMLSGRNQTVLQPNEVLRQLFMQSNAGAFDRGLVERIIRCLGVFPIGSLVELNTGERGIVVAANRADTLKPTVRIVATRTGLNQSNGPIVSLADTSPGVLDRRIVCALDPGRERIDPLAFLKLAQAVPA